MVGNVGALMMMMTCMEAGTKEIGNVIIMEIKLRLENGADKTHYVVIRCAASGSNRVKGEALRVR